jgi:basic membrane lipoprotein Med (substrate-binding protein (PBP1-ABC) superfamily)
MQRLFSRFSSLTAAAALLSFAAACGEKDAAKSLDSSAVNQPKIKVALLTPGPISDQAWNGGAYDGLVRVRDGANADISHIQTKTPAEFEENFRQYGEQGYALVFGHGFEFQDAATRVAPSYPKTVFVITSGRVTAPNVAGMSFAFEEASYQAGILAGATTKTNTIGAIGGQEFPPVKASFAAFERGAKSVNPNVKVIVSYIGNWEDVSAGKEQALAQITRGVDIIFQNADAAGLGIFQAARERKVLAFGANVDQSPVAPDVVLASVAIDFPRAFLNVANEVKSGTFQGRVLNLGLRDSIVKLVYNPALKDRIPATAVAAADSVGQQMVSGAFHELDDVLQGSDAAKPLPPAK